MSKKEEFKAKIGRAAMECFEKYGLEKTTLEDISKAVGLNKSSLYYYYKSKEDIFIEAALREGEHYITMLQEATLSKFDVEEQISFYLESRFNYYTNILNMNRVSIESVEKLLPRFFELYDKLMIREKEFLTEILTNAVDRNEIKLSDPKNMASALINFANALKHNTEQQAILKKEKDINYTESLADTKYLLSVIFKGIKIT